MRSPAQQGGAAPRPTAARPKLTPDRLHRAAVDFGGHAAAGSAGRDGLHLGLVEQVEVAAAADGRAGREERRRRGWIRNVSRRWPAAGAHQPTSVPAQQLQPPPLTPRPPALALTHPSGVRHTFRGARGRGGSCARGEGRGCVLSRRRVAGHERLKRISKKCVPLRRSPIKLHHGERSPAGGHLRQQWGQQLGRRKPSTRVRRQAAGGAACTAPHPRSPSTVSALPPHVIEEGQEECLCRETRGSRPEGSEHCLLVASATREPQPVGQAGMLAPHAAAHPRAGSTAAASAPCRTRGAAGSSPFLHSRHARAGSPAVSGCAAQPDACCTGGGVNFY